MVYSTWCSVETNDISRLAIIIHPEFTTGSIMDAATWMRPRHSFGSLIDDLFLFVPVGDIFPLHYDRLPTGSIVAATSIKGFLR